LPTITEKSFNKKKKKILKKATKDCLNLVIFDKASLCFIALM